MAVLRVLVRIVVVPLKLIVEVGGIAFRLGVTVGRVPVRAGRAVTRRLGWRGVVLVQAGFVAGLLLAPMRGRELRSRIAGLLGAGAAPPGDLTERVTFELAHAPRTWHLPQPAVEVRDDVVTLRGSVPHEDAREELIATAGALPGVGTVLDELVTEEPAP